MARERDADSETDVELGNGDTLAERIERVDLDADATCSIDELRERLGV